MQKNTQDLKFAKLQSDLQAHQYLFDLHPDTRLPLSQAAFLIGKTQLTLGVDITRRPEKIPKFIRTPGGRIFFIKKDIDSWLNQLSNPAPSPTEPEIKRGRGRPRKADQLNAREV